MKYKFDFEVTSLEEYMALEEWCRNNAPGDWTTTQFGFSVLVQLSKAQDATAFRLTFGI
jgi:hypothetical protein